MKSRPIGICLIVNNITFDEDKTLRPRRGAEEDVKNLKEVFEKLHFDVMIETDKTAAEMDELFNQVSKNEKLANLDSFVSVVMSHGGLGDVIYGTDGNTITVHEIAKKFNNKNCKALLGKPKLFFISACRGGI